MTFDRLGVWLSSACLIHCAGTTVLLLFLPAMSIGGDDSLHRTLSIVLPAIALVAFAHGFARHRDWRVPLLGVFGLLLVVFAAWSPLPETAEACITVGGSLALIAAHRRNRRLSHARCC